MKSEPCPSWYLDFVTLLLFLINIFIFIARRRSAIGKECTVFDEVSSILLDPPSGDSLSLRAAAISSGTSKLLFISLLIVVVVEMMILSNYLIIDVERLFTV
jgi:hypothetical protein